MRMQISKEEKDFYIKFSSEIDVLKDEKKLIESLKDWSKNYKDIIEDESRFFIVKEEDKKEVYLN